MRIPSIIIGLPVVNSIAAVWIPHQSSPWYASGCNVRLNFNALREAAFGAGVTTVVVVMDVSEDVAVAFVTEVMDDGSVGATKFAGV